MMIRLEVATAETGERAKVPKGEVPETWRPAQRLAHAQKGIRGRNAPWERLAAPDPSATGRRMERSTHVEEAPRLLDGTLDARGPDFDPATEG